METYGLHFRYRLCGQPPTIMEEVFQDTEVIHAGDLVSLQSNLVDLAATGDTDLAGVAVEYVSGTTAVSKIKFICDADAVYAVTDASARSAGAKLDISGATGAMLVTTDSNSDLTVAAASTATEPTLVMITHAGHFMHE